METKLPLTIRTTPLSFFGMMGFVSLAFFVPGILFLFNLTAGAPSSEAPVLGAVLCFLGAAIAAISALLYSKRPQTILSHEGIWSSPYSRSPISWDAIKTVRVATQGRRGRIRWIALDVIDEVAQTLSKKSRLNRGLGYGDINVSTYGTNVSFEDAIKIITERVQESHVHDAGTRDKPQ